MLGETNELLPPEAKEFAAFCIAQLPTRMSAVRVRFATSSASGDVCLAAGRHPLRLSTRLRPIPGPSAAELS